MTDRYAIDVPGFLGLAGDTARRLDDLTDAVGATVQALWGIRDAMAPVPELFQAFCRVMDPWEEKAGGSIAHAGSVLTVAEQAVAEYCRADVVMAVTAAQLETRRGTGRWRVA
ncbi:hypothetical protein P2P98_07105 [Microbacterium sp. Kw_RZR3]|uniref:hypothetical protein n=1 Tax=Microbacterium sp. Kw_RZR3 TaxID=3032903 RepID=UPI0023DB732E|nr:hypothetical protein [Microbacterium sp. Kw_RZR3]MDF2045925.1 hypothetical protein [Microbacterium sp. Kw_RZR3]